MRFLTVCTVVLLTISLDVSASYKITQTSTVVNCTGTNGTPGGCSQGTATTVDQTDDWVDYGIGNPINALTGNKFESATDIEAIGGEYALRLNRYYNSRSTQRGLFGKGWRSDYEMQLQDTGDKIDVLQTDGRKISFTKTADKLDNSSLLITRYKADKPELGYLERTQSTDISKPAWIWHLPDGKAFEFIAHKQTGITNSDGRYRFGQLSRVTENTNQSSSGYWSLTYDVKGNLAQVQNHLGDTLKFSYQTTKYGLPKIIISKSERNNSGSQAWQYFLDKKGNLAQVVSPVGERTGYSYTDPNDPHNLTAKYSYDKQGNKSLITKWEYDAYDRAISSTHKNGIEKVTVAYDPDTLIPMPAGHVFTNTITNSIGETTEYRYRYREDDAQLLSATGAGCATCGPTNVSYEYDSAGRLIRENMVDDEGRVVSSVSKEFDKFGRLIKQSSRSSSNGALETSVHYQYVSENPESPRFALISKQWSASVASGKQTGIEYQYNDNGFPIKKEEFGYTPDGDRISRTYLMTYDSKGNITQVALKNNLNPDSDPLVLEAYSWFENGSLKSASRPNLGITTSFEHNKYGLTTKVERVIGDNVSTIHFEYDNKPYPVSMSRYQNGTLINGVKYKRNNLGRITSVTDLNGNFIASYAYDDANRNLGEIAPQRAALRHLDTEGRPIVDYEITATNADKLSYQYDSKGRIIGAGRDDTQLVAVNYSEDNNTAEIIGASGAQLIAHKSDNELNSYELPNTWDGLGIKQTHINPMQAGIIEVKQNNGLITKCGYDDFGRIAYIDSSSTGRNYYAYDEQDQLVGIKLASGLQITYQYDPKGRRIHKSTKQNNEIVQEVSWKYNANDQLISAKESHQTTEYTYNEQGRVTEKRVVLEGLTKPLVTHFSYDKNDSISRITLPDGIELLSEDKGIGYKAPNDLKARIIFKENETQNGQNHDISYQLGQHIVMGHYYDNNGQFAGLSYRTLPKSGSNPFIKSAQASTPNFSPLFSQQWQRTDEGIVDQVTEVDYQGKPIEYNYLYDSQYHLISSSYQPIKLDSDLKPVTTDKDTDTVTDKEEYQARYLYDELGNRLLGDEQSQSLNKYQYNDKGLLTQVTPLAQAVKGDLNSVKNISYNEAGLPTQYGDYRLEYTAGQVTTIKDSKDQLIAEYTYNDLGQRIKKRVYQEDKKQLESPKTTYYVYEDSQLQYELDGDGNIIRHYVYIGDTLTATIDYPSYERGQTLTPEQSGISVWQRSKNWVSKLWGQKDAYPKVNYVITDYLGRPRQVRDGESNSLKWQFKPTAFGGSVDKAFADKDYQLNIRFPGQYEDSETGLYYNHWRYYDQNTGRYISADPLGLGGGENLYAYVNAAPTHFIDPPGLLLFAFDGTNNKDYDSSAYSNVVKFRDLYRINQNPNEPREPNFYKSGKKWKYSQINNSEGNKGFIEFKKQNKSFSNINLKNNVFYMAGAGTKDQYSNVSADLKSGGNKLDLGHGLSMVKRVDAMTGYLFDYLDHVYKDPSVIQRDEKGFVTSNYKINLDIVGFSRGAASARMFASKVKTIMTTGRWSMYDQTILGNPKQGTKQTWQYTTNFLRNCGIDFDFNFMGLMDTVPAYGSNQGNDMADLDQFGMSLAVDDTFKSVVHAVAMNENRFQFSRRSIYASEAEATGQNGKKVNDKLRLEKGFLGAHSDIGGGYQEGDLSNASLMWIIKYAKEAGVSFDDSMINSKKYNRVDDPVVHDSVARFFVFTPGSQFLWANNNAMQFETNSIFRTRDHLELSWDYIKDNFENPDNSKMDTIEDLTEDFLATGSKFREGDLAGMLTTHPIQFKRKMNNYKGLKSKGKSKAPDILFDTDKSNNIIAVNDYLLWLNCHYDLQIATSVTKASNLSGDTRMCQNLP